MILPILLIFGNGFVSVKSNFPCVRLDVSNLFPEKKTPPLPGKYQAQILNKLSTEVPLEITANLIDAEDYWKRLENSSRLQKRLHEKRRTVLSIALVRDHYPL